MRTFRALEQYDTYLFLKLMSVLRTRRLLAVRAASDQESERKGVDLQ